MAEYIHYVLVTSNNLLAAKIAVEAIVLTPPNVRDLLLKRSIEINNEWISETAFRSCRHLPQIGLELVDNFKSLFMDKTVLDLIRRRKEFQFSLSLSEAFKEVKTFISYILFDYKFPMRAKFSKETSFG